MSSMTRRDLLCAGGAVSALAFASAYEDAQRPPTGAGNAAAQGTNTHASVMHDSPQPAPPRIEFLFYGLTLLVRRQNQADVLCMNAQFNPMMANPQWPAGLEAHKPWLRIVDGTVPNLQGLGMRTSLGILIDLFGRTLALPAFRGAPIIAKAGDPTSSSAWDPLDWVPELKWLDSVSKLKTAGLEPNANGPVLSSVKLAGGRLSAVRPSSAIAESTTWKMGSVVRPVTDQFMWSADIRDKPEVELELAGGSHPPATLQIKAEKPTNLIRLELVHMPERGYRMHGTDLQHAKAYHHATDREDKKDYAHPTLAAGVTRTGGGDPICVVFQTTA